MSESIISLDTFKIYYKYSNRRNNIDIIFYINNRKYKFKNISSISLTIEELVYKNDLVYYEDIIMIDGLFYDIIIDNNIDDYMNHILHIKFFNHNTHDLVAKIPIKCKIENIYVNFIKQGILWFLN